MSLLQKKKIIIICKNHVFIEKKLLCFHSISRHAIHAYATLELVKPFRNEKMSKNYK